MVVISGYFYFSECFLAFSKFATTNVLTVIKRLGFCFFKKKNNENYTGMLKEGLTKSCGIKGRGSSQR